MMKTKTKNTGFEYQEGLNWNIILTRVCDGNLPSLTGTPHTLRRPITPPQSPPQDRQEGCMQTGAVLWDRQEEMER